MKHFILKARKQREAGAALITVLLVSICTAMLLAASLTVALTTTKLGWKQSDSEAAMQLADAGINSELQFVGLNATAATKTGRSSQPVVYSGVTAVRPSMTTPVLGRPGTVPGYTGGTYYVYSSNNAAGTVAWDGVQSPFYITCSAVVSGCWQTVQIQSQSTSLFNVYGIFSGGDSGSTPTVTVNPGSTVTVTGPAGVNGTVSQDSSCTFVAPTCINANCGNHSSGQLKSSNCSSGGHLCQVQQPLVYPKTSDCCRNCFGCDPGDSDDTAWTACQNHSCNASGCIYHYSSSASDSTINTHNCDPLPGGCGNQLTNSCWANANIKPGTYTSNYWWWWQNPTVAVQTLIFEPGDYYFTSMQLAYDASKEMVIDPCAYASGGTPGQVRFWCHGGTTDDYVQCPITNTCASGTSTPDPGLFRIYYDKDNCTCTFQRPDNITDWTGNTRNDDFNYYCGIYACTKPCGDTSSKCGTNIGFTGTNNTNGCGSSNHGKANLCGSMLCDHLKFQGCCNANYTVSKTCTKDPCSGGCAVSWSCHSG